MSGSRQLGDMLSGMFELYEGSAGQRGYYVECRIASDIHDQAAVDAMQWAVRRCCQAPHAAPVRSERLPFVLEGLGT